MQEEYNDPEELYENFYCQDDTDAQIQDKRITEYKTLKNKMLTHNYAPNDPNYGEAQIEIINNALSIYSSLRKKL
jgi:hypothetical protein